MSRDMAAYTLWDGRKLTPLPLPGGFPVLTWQWNLTIYPGAGSVRVTSAIREPSEKEAIHVAKFEFPWFALAEQELRGHAVDTFRAMGYLSGLTKGI